jgi:hypothetical protein
VVSTGYRLSSPVDVASAAGAPAVLVRPVVRPVSGVVLVLVSGRWPVSVVRPVRPDGQRA